MSGKKSLFRREVVQKMKMWFQWVPEQDAMASARCLQSHTAPRGRLFGILCLHYHHVPGDWELILINKLIKFRSRKRIACRWSTRSCIGRALKVSRIREVKNYGVRNADLQLWLHCSIFQKCLKNRKTFWLQEKRRCTLRVLKERRTAYSLCCQVSFYFTNEEFWVADSISKLLSFAKPF